MAESKFDGYMNVFLGHGTRRWDPFWHTRYKGPGYGIASMWGEFDDLFTHNGIAKKIIKAPADEAMRAGFTLKDGDVELDQNDAVQSLLEDLNVEQKISTALCWDRLFGGGAILMMADDGNELTAPLDLSHVRGVESLEVFDAQDVTPTRWFRDPTDPRYGRPQTYSIISYNGGSFWVDESRLLIFDGELVSNTVRRARDGWGGSVLEAVADALKRLEGGEDNAQMALERLSQSILKLAGLAELLSTDFGESEVQKRVQLIDMVRGLMNTLVLDSEDEFDLKNISLAGVKDILEKFETTVCAAADIPATVLFGRAPDGMNSTGESDMENYYNMVARIQGRKVKPALYRLLRVLNACSDYGLNLPECYTIEFNKLWNPSAKEVAETKQAEAQARANEANAAAVYVNMGALDPLEVRDKLDDGDEYKLDRSLDKVVGGSDDGNSSET